MGVFNLLDNKIGIDAGSSTIRISKKGNLIFNEPSQISIDTKENKISGIGLKAKSNNSNELLNPVDYVIADFQAFEFLLRGSIKHGEKKQPWFPISYVMYFSLPIKATEVEKRAYRDSAEHAGAKEVYMIASLCSAAIGMNILYEKKDFILIDFSTSKIEIAIFINSLPIITGHIRLGTSYLENAIKNHLNRAFGIKVNQDEIHSIINSYGSKEELISIQYKEIPMGDIDRIIDGYLLIVKDDMLSCSEKLTPEQKSRVLLNDIYFTGGGCGYDSICLETAQIFDKDYILSSNPFLDIINGVNIVMKNPKDYENYLMH